jgi:hypothetical protein
MPTNRKRRARAWSPDLNDYERQLLLDGPEAVLIAGEGFRGLTHFAASAAERAASMGDARAAWVIHGPALLRWWLGEGEDATRKPWAWVAPGGPGTRPWAWWQFDAPEPRDADETQADYLIRHGLLLPGEDLHKGEGA